MSSAPDDELGEYERGFIDAWLHCRGIGVPTKEQFIEALAELERFLDLQETSGPKAN